MSSTLWFVLGDGVRPSPMELFREPGELTVHHMGDFPFNIAQMCWFSAGSYHVPPTAQRLFRAKKYPFHAVATCEQGDAGPDFPSRPSRIETYLARDFTLGTATTPLCGGEQTMSYFVTYKRREPVGSFRDVGTVLTKLVLDDDVPGIIGRPAYRAPAGEEFRKLPPPATPPQYSNSGEEDHLHSYANTITLQAESTALVLTHPHLALGGPADSAGIIQTAKPRQIRRLSEMVIFPAHFGGVDEVIVGGQPRTDWSGPVERGEWIACRCGKLLIAIRPMAYSRTLGPAAITLERANAYQFIRFTYYQGAERTFTRAELRHVFGGFLAEHASVDEYPSLAAFAADVAQTRFTDYFWTTRRVRCRRPTTSVRPALEFEVSWSPGSQIPRIAAVNGRDVEWPVVKIDGLKPKNFPFLAEPFASVPAFFPWQDFRVEWGDWPYAINDRESGAT
jgi:hypothetical protein